MKNRQIQCIEHSNNQGIETANPCLVRVIWKSKVTLAKPVELVLSIAKSIFHSVICCSALKRFLEDREKAASSSLE